MRSPGMNRRRFLTASLTAASAAALWLRLGGAEASGFEFEPEKNIIPAPKDPTLWPEFRRQLSEWRQSQRAQLHY